MSKLKCSKLISLFISSAIICSGAVGCSNSQNSTVPSTTHNGNEKQELITNSTKDNKISNNDNNINTKDEKNNNTVTAAKKTSSENYIHNIIIKEKDYGENNTFYLGMKKEDALKRLQELKLDSKIETIQTCEENLQCSCSNSYGDDGHPQDLLYIDTDSTGLGAPEDRIVFSLNFDIKDHKLLSIDPPNIPTSLGLKRGDSLDDMEKLYGTNYDFYGSVTAFPEVGDNNETVYCKIPYIYEYKIDDHFFRVYIVDNKVMDWAISSFKIQKRISLNNKTFCLCCALKPKSIEGLSKDDLEILKNAYYAKYGYIFKSDKYTYYFPSVCQWYTPQYENVDKFLTKTDWQNIDLIIKFEKTLSKIEEKYNLK